jgi:hypothetical protein
MRHFDDRDGVKQQTEAEKSNQDSPAPSTTTSRGFVAGRHIRSGWVMNHRSAHQTVDSERAEQHEKIQN